MITSNPDLAAAVECSQSLAVVINSDGSFALPDSDAGREAVASFSSGTLHVSASALLSARARLGYLQRRAMEDKEAKS